MQVGDLVELSASAKKLIWTKRYLDKIGIIISMKYYNWIEVKWCGNAHQPRVMKEMFTRSNLKYAKVKKE
jgi:hypothetical protein